MTGRLFTCSQVSQVVGRPVYGAAVPAVFGEDGLAGGGALVAGRVHVPHHIPVPATQLFLTAHKAVPLARQPTQSSRVPRLRLHLLKRPETATERRSGGQSGPRGTVRDLSGLRAPGAVRGPVRTQGAGQGASQDSGPRGGQGPVRTQGAGQGPVRTQGPGGGQGASQDSGPRGGQGASQDSGPRRRSGGLSGLRAPEAVRGPVRTQGAGQGASQDSGPRGRSGGQSGLRTPGRSGTCQDSGGRSGTCQDSGPRGRSGGQSGLRTQGRSGGQSGLRAPEAVRGPVRTQGRSGGQSGLRRPVRGPFRGQFGPRA